METKEKEHGIFVHSYPSTVKLQWLKHLWDYKNLFETGVV